MWGKGCATTRCQGLDARPAACSPQQKLSTLGLDQAPEEFVKSLPASVQRRVEALQELQNKRDELESEFVKERAELEAKYEKLYGGSGDQTGRSVHRHTGRGELRTAGMNLHKLDSTRLGAGSCSVQERWPYAC